MKILQFVLKAVTIYVSMGYCAQLNGRHNGGGGKDLDFKICVKQQIKIHPFMEPKDMYKMCFQAAFGAEHLISDRQKAREYLTREFEQTKASTNEPLIEWLSEGVARVNIAPYKAAGYPLETLLDLFITSASDFAGSTEMFLDYLEQIAELAKEESFRFGEKQWRAFCQDRQIGPVHHSEIYREKEHPAYRVIAGQAIKALECLTEKKVLE